MVSEEMTVEEMKRKRVEERVDDMIGFYKHLTVYVIVNLIIFTLWLWNHLETPTFPWFIFPMGGWGIGLLFHFLNVFVWNNFDDWREKKVRELMEEKK